MGALVSLLAVAMVMPSALAASAQPLKAAPTQEEREAGLWYTRDLKFDEIRDMGLTGKGIKIAVIDSAINLEAAELKGADIEVRGTFCEDKGTGEVLPAVSDDPARGHGTGVVSMLLGNGVANDGGLGTRGITPDAKVLFYSDGDVDAKCKAVNPVSGKTTYPDFFSKEDPLSEEWGGQLGTLSGHALAAAQAIEDGADIISFSAGGDSPLDWSFVQALALRAGVPIVAATNNPENHSEAKSLPIIPIPSRLNGVVAVSGVDENLDPLYVLDEDDKTFRRQAPGSSNLAFAGPAMGMLSPRIYQGWGPGYEQFGGGNSVTTPLVAGVIALGMERHPEASAFQVLQAMIRTTGSGEYTAEPEWIDAQYGYGLVNPVAMLAVDPTQFPDENPLFVVSPEDPRCGANAKTMEECQWADSPVASDVWPAKYGAGDNVGSDVAGKADQNEDSSLLAIVLFVAIGLLVIGLIATAIIVPITVSRSRKKKQSLAAQGSATGWDYEHAAPQPGGARFDPNAPVPAHQPPQMQTQSLVQQPPMFEGERSE